MNVPTNKDSCWYGQTSFNISSSKMYVAVYATNTSVDYWVCRIFKHLNHQTDCCVSVYALLEYINMFGWCVVTLVMCYILIPFSSKEQQASLPVRLALDGIHDPMNFGAILRCAYYLGVDKVVTGKNK